MSKADKMFEELGYKKKIIDWGFGPEYYEYSSSDTYIVFWENLEIINISNIINTYELKAINKKCKELGWI